MVSYTSQGERDRTLRLAEARQQIAHEGNGNPTWQELTDDERGTSELAARNWLRAAERAGLLAEHDDSAGQKTAAAAGPVHAAPPFRAVDGVPCPDCNGRGLNDDDEPCLNCGGTGWDGDGE